MASDSATGEGENGPGDAGGEAEALARGLELLRRGLFFEAHERFEDRWRVARGSARTLFHGLAQLAASYHQLDRGRARAAARTWEKARRKLVAVDALPSGFDDAVRTLFAAVDATPEGPHSVDPGRLPSRDAWPVPDGLSESARSPR